MDTYDDHGIAFQYPTGWELEVTDEEGPVTTVSLHSPTGPAFALVTLDESCPNPDEVAELALDAMREEYPALAATPARERINGREAVGHDVEFFSLDMASACSIRCFQTDRRTVLLFAQWSDTEGDEAGDVLSALRNSLEETD